MARVARVVVKPTTTQVKRSNELIKKVMCKLILLQQTFEINSGVRIKKSQRHINDYGNIFGLCRG